MAKAAGYSRVTIDGTIIEVDRCATPGPTVGVDLWWSKKHHNHGGSIQVITAPDGWPIWISPVRPGREHDITALRAHPQLLSALTAAKDNLRTLADLGYEGGDRRNNSSKRPGTARSWLQGGERSHRHHAGSQDSSTG